MARVIFLNSYENLEENSKYLGVWVNEKGTLNKHQYTPKQHVSISTVCKDIEQEGNILYNAKTFGEP